jgi:ABC-2 type transport system permease protein
MRSYALFKKALIENFRDWKILILTLSFAPFFVYLMYFYMGQASKTFRIVIINNDQEVLMRDGTPFNGGRFLMGELERAEYPDGTKILSILKAEDADEARRLLTSKSAILGVEIPVNFSKTLMEYKDGNKPPPTHVKTYGDFSSAQYMLAASWTDYIISLYVGTAAGLKSPIIHQAENISQGESKSEFDLYVPALLALALIMLMFTAAASLIKEKDKFTIVRLRLSRMTRWDWFSAVSVVQVLIGMLALGFAYLSAVSVGYKTTGSLLAFGAVGVLSCISIMAISLIVAAFLRTIFDLMTIGCFPFFILMFFSGGMLPLPPLRLFTIGGHAVNLNAILPTTHSTSAFGKILNSGSGLKDVAFELCAIGLLSIVYFAVGVWMFTRRHLQAK